MVRKVPSSVHAVSSLKRQGFAKTISEMIETNTKIIDLNKKSLKKLEDEVITLKKLLSEIEQERALNSKSKKHVFEDETSVFWDDYWKKQIRDNI